MLNFISLFTGIGGFDLGFEQAGMTCILQVEKDKQCLNLLNRKWPNVPKHRKVQDVGRENLQPADLICGGFPCQDVSTAGRREGLAGERSGLWFEFHRIIEEIKPEWVVVENVPGLLSSNRGRDMGAIVGGLAELGYWWAYRVLDAQYFGVPQRRRRVFIVGCLTRGRAQEVLFERESSPWDTPPSRETGKNFTAAITERTRRNGRQLEAQLDLAYALDNPGNGGRTQTRLVAFSAGQSGKAYDIAADENVTPPLRAGESGTNRVPTIAFGGNNMQGPVSVAMVRNAHGSGRYDFESETFITNAFNGYTGGADDNDAQGNHIIPDREYQGDRIIEESQIWPTLPSQGANNGGGAGAILHQHQIGVRRLIPLECERLQGFPDSWTEGQSDSARYRQLGNAVCVPVARWIGQRIYKCQT